MIVSGSDDNLVSIWRVSDGQIMNKLNGHTE
jgi:WD40 repeat protein